jgi:hypothetical protein
MWKLNQPTNQLHGARELPEKLTGHQLVKKSKLQITLRKYTIFFIFYIDQPMHN